MTLKEYEQSYGPEQEQQQVPELPVELPQFNLLNQLNMQRSQINFVHSSSKWFNGCEYKCQLCARTLFSVAGLSMHLKADIDLFEHFPPFSVPF